MYAVIESGGSQHRVEQGSVLRLQRLPGDVGSTCNFDSVLLLVDGSDVQAGQPFVKGASVSARIVSQGRADKVRIVKMKRRKHYRRQMGHRQAYTEVEVLAIDNGKGGKGATGKSGAGTAPKASTAGGGTAATKTASKAKAAPGTTPAKPAAKKPAATKKAAAKAKAGSGAKPAKPAAKKAAAAKKPAAKTAKKPGDAKAGSTAKSPDKED